MDDIQQQMQEDGKQMPECTWNDGVRYLVFKENTKSKQENDLLDELAVAAGSNKPQNAIGLMLSNAQKKKDGQCDDDDDDKKEDEEAEKGIEIVTDIEMTAMGENAAAFDSAPESHASF